ncbi:MAG: MarC family protein [Nitrospirae bacterium]|nr:MarC family protein [Nitrospirota bacterium]
MLNTFIPLFVAIDVFAVLPIFISLTSDLTDAKRKAIIRQSTVTALLVSLLFVAIGNAVFRILGITVDDFKIAGGLILLVIAILDIIRFEDRRKAHETIGVVPIGVPLIVGPAVLTTLIVLIANYGILPTTISLVLNLIIVWISFARAQKITKLFGRNGIAAISKVMALLLAAIAIMMIRLGIEVIIR